MAIQRSCNLAITLLLSLVILLALAPPSSANALSPEVRDHVNLNRMIKRRAPHALLPRQVTPANRPQAQGGAVGAAADPSSGGPSSSASSSTSAASASSSSQAPESSKPISLPVSSALSSAVSSFFWRYFRVINTPNRFRLFCLRRARAQRAQLVPPHPLQRQALPPPQLLPPLLRRAPRRRRHRQTSSYPLPRVNPFRLTR